MDDALDDKLYGLVEIAERQQVIVQAVLEKLVSEREALQQERSEWSDRINSIDDHVHSTIFKAVEESMAGLTDKGADTVRRLSEPLAESVAQISLQATQAETALRGLVKWASWRSLRWGLSAISSLAVLWWLASCAVLWWDTSAIGAAQAQKVQIETELAGLRANHDAWVKAGMLAKVERCGQQKRFCVQVDEGAGQFGKDSDYRIVQGY